MLLLSLPPSPEQVIEKVLLPELETVTVSVPLVDVWFVQDAEHDEAFEADHERSTVEPTSTEGEELVKDEITAAIS